LLKYLHYLSALFLCINFIKDTVMIMVFSVLIALIAAVEVACVTLSVPQG
jgi:hypothetical protein